MATKKQKREQLEAKRAAQLAETKRLNALALEKDRKAREKKAQAIKNREIDKKVNHAKRTVAEKMRGMVVIEIPGT